MHAILRATSRNTGSTWRTECAGIMQLTTGIRTPFREMQRTMRIIPSPASSMAPSIGQKYSGTPNVSISDMGVPAVLPFNGRMVFMIVTIKPYRRNFANSFVTYRT